MSKKREFLTIIGLSAEETIDSDRLTAELSNRDPDRTYRITRIPLGPDPSTSGLAIEVEGVQFTIVPRHQPVNPKEYASAVAAALLTWKAASGAVRDAKADIVIAANQVAADHPAAVKTAFLLTAITAAVASLARPVFFYWGTADLLVEPAEFAAASDAMLASNQPPILQWIRFGLFRGPDGPQGATGGMRSRGLAGFVGFELQLDPVSMPPIELARRAVGYAEHLVREGPPTLPAEIDGPAAGERIAVTRRPAAGGDVVHLQLLGPR